MKNARKAFSQIAAIRTVSVILVVAILLVALTQTAFAKNTYVITDGNRVVIHTTNATDPARVLDEAGLSLGATDSYVANRSNGMSEIKIHRVHTVTVNNCGQIQEVVSNGETVEELLTRVHVNTDENAKISASFSDVTFDGMVITISRNIDVEEEYSVEIPYETEYVMDDTLEEGVEQLLQKGQNGESHCTGIVYYTNGVETGRTVISEQVVTEPVNEIILVGTAPIPETVHDVVDGEDGGQIILSTGEVINYYDRIDVLATAYTCEGWSTVGITATGTVARVGEIAVDPSIIPLGSKLFIRSADGEYIYGVAYAEDTGGLINGYRIDLYYDTEAECIQFGARMCEVYFID